MHPPGRRSTPTARRDAHAGVYRQTRDTLHASYRRYRGASLNAGETRPRYLLQSDGPVHARTSRRGRAKGEGDPSTSNVVARSCIAAFPIRRLSMNVEFLFRTDNRELLNKTDSCLSSLLCSSYVSSKLQSGVLLELLRLNT